MLKFNLDLVERYIGLFDGLRIIKIADGKKHQLPEFLKDAEIVDNDPVNGEAPHFKRSIKQITFGHTFYAHAKGISRPVNKPLKWWIEQLYKGNLDSKPNLKDHMVSGCFGKLRPGSIQVPVPWHYSGSFFWFRQEIVERYRLMKVPANIDNRWFTENFCGWLVKQKEAEFRLHASADHIYNLYSEKFWAKHTHLIPGK